METRRRLLDAATTHFSEREYSEVSVADITETAGVAHGLLFHYFKNKRGLYLEVMRQATQEIDWSTHADRGLPFYEQLRQLLEQQLRYLAKHRGLALRLVLGGRGTDADTWEIFEAGRWRAIEWICARLGLDARSDALQIALRAAAGAIDEATAHWLTQDEPYDASEVADALTLLTANSLAAAARLDPSIDVEAALARAVDSPPAAP